MTLRGFWSEAPDTEPVVIQVPDFGERFWVYALRDQRTDQLFSPSWSSSSIYREAQ